MFCPSSLLNFSPLSKCSSLRSSILSSLFRILLFFCSPCTGASCSASCYYGCCCLRRRRRRSINDYNLHRFHFEDIFPIKVLDFWLKWPASKKTRHTLLHFSQCPDEIQDNFIIIICQIIINLNIIIITILNDIRFLELLPKPLHISFSKSHLHLTINFSLWWHEISSTSLCSGSISFYLIYLLQILIILIN